MHSSLLLVSLIVVGCTTTSAGSADAKRDTQPASQNEDGICTPVYTQAGCDGTVVPAFCDHGGGGACGGAVCDCEGHLQYTNCGYSPVRFAYRVDPRVLGQEAGNTCDPHAFDAGSGGVGGASAGQDR